MKKTLYPMGIFGSLRKASNTYLLHNLTDVPPQDVSLKNIILCKFYRLHGEKIPHYGANKKSLTNLENLKKRILSK